jgi:hypothetical protein
MPSFKSNIEQTEKSSDGDFRNDKKEEALHLSLNQSLTGRRTKAGELWLIGEGISPRDYDQGKSK